MDENIITYWLEIENENGQEFDWDKVPGMENYLHVSPGSPLPNEGQTIELYVDVDVQGEAAGHYLFSVKSIEHLVLQNSARKWEDPHKSYIGRGTIFLTPIKPKEWWTDASRLESIMRRTDRE